MVPQRHTDDLAKELPNLDMAQGYLVRRDADPNLPLASRAQTAIPGITYASMRVSVVPLDSSMGKPAAGGSGGDSPCGGGSTHKGGSKKGSGSGKGGGKGSEKGGDKSNEKASDSGEQTKN